MLTYKLTSGPFAFGAGFAGLKNGPKHLKKPCFDCQKGLKANTGMRHQLSIT
jgi:hypothetical protein